MYALSGQPGLSCKDNMAMTSYNMTINKAAVVVCPPSWIWKAGFNARLWSFTKSNKISRVYVGPSFRPEPLAERASGFQFISIAAALTSDIWCM